MNGVDFFTQLNSKLDAIPSPSDPAAHIQSTFSQLCAELASHCAAGDALLAGGEGLGVFEGRVVDIFDGEIETVQLADAQGNASWAAFGHLGPDDAFTHKASHRVHDSLTFLMLVRAPNAELCARTWQSLNAAAAGWGNASAGFPLLVKAYAGAEDVRLGQWVRVWGYASRAAAAEPRDADPSFRDFRDYYQQHLVSQVCCLRIETRREQPPAAGGAALLELLGAAARNVSGSAHFARLLLAGLVTAEEPRPDGIDHLSVNFHRCSPDALACVLALFSRFGIAGSRVAVDAAALAGDVFAEKDAELGVMRLRTLHPGMEGPVVLDELGLGEARLGEKATLNVMRLDELVQNRRIVVGFAPQTFLPFAFSAALFSFSAQKSIFKFDVRAAVDASAFDPALAAALPFLGSAAALAAELQAARQRVAAVAFAPGLREKLQEDYVNRRRAGSFPPALFQQAIKLAKHLAGAERAPSLAFDHYADAVGLLCPPAAAANGHA